MKQSAPAPIVDYRYAKDFLNRINQAVAASDDFTHSEWKEGWQAAQLGLFTLLKQYSLEKKIPSRTPILKALLKKGLHFFLWFFALLIHLCGHFRLKTQRDGVLIFSVDNANSTYNGDRRIDYLYTFCQNEQIPFTEIFHTALGKKCFSHFWQRKRAALYLEVGSTFFAFFTSFQRRHLRISLQNVANQGNFTVPEQLFLTYALPRLIPMILALPYQVTWLTRLLKHSSIKAVFGIDDARHYHALSQACRNIDIPFYAFQHGHYTPYHVGWLEAIPGSKPSEWHPEHLVVWSNYWKQELLSLRSVFTDTEIMIGGYRESISVYPPHQNDKMIHILIPYETDTKTAVAAFIDRLEDDPRILISLKTRPDMPEERQRTEYCLRGLNSRVRIASRLDTVLPEIDLVIGTYSTLLYDCLGYGKPIAVLDIPNFDFGQGLIKNDLADRINGERDFSFEQLQIILKNGEKKINERRTKLFGAEPVYIKDWLQKTWYTHIL